MTRAIVLSVGTRVAQTSRRRPGEPLPYCPAASVSVSERFTLLPLLAAAGGPAATVPLPAQGRGRL